MERDLDRAVERQLDLELAGIHLGMTDELIRKYQNLTGCYPAHDDGRQRQLDAYLAVVDAFETGMVVAAREALAALRDLDVGPAPRAQATDLIRHLDRLITGAAPTECVRYFTDVSELDQAEISRIARQHDIDR